MNRFYLKVLVGMVLCLVLTTGIAFSYICANGAGGGYCDPDINPECTSSGSSDSESTILSRSKIQSDARIEYQIEEGGGFFLKSVSKIMAMSNRVEMSNLNGVDHDELLKIVHDGLENIRYAKYSYYLLIQTAEATPYNQHVISKLKFFGYKDYMIKHSLNSVIFKEVENYLRNGDITGTFKRFYSEIICIEGLLMKIKDEVALNKIPDISIIWRVNEAASNNLLFSQYVARVFFELSK